MKLPYTIACIAFSAFIVVGIALETGHPGATFIPVGAFGLICTAAVAFEKGNL